jgi:lambda family phage portal protein
MRSNAHGAPRNREKPPAAPPKQVESYKTTETKSLFERKYREIKAKYEAALDTDDNAKHWNNADDLGPNPSASHDVRAKLRKRARHEYDNSSYCKGMVLTYANEIVGTGPRLQLQTSNEKANQQIERLFANWSEAVGLPDLLQLAFKERLVTGEMFILKTTNPLLEDPVKLDLRAYEADQIHTPFPKFSQPGFPAKTIDGIRYDKWGNPASYDLLPAHPGGEGDFSILQHQLVPMPIAAEYMLHWFRAERPGQRRGIPDLTPSLPNFNQLRRYCLAVLSAAELAASFAAIIKTQYPPGHDAAGAADPVPFELIEIVRGMMQTLPLGASMEQLRAEQPTTAFAEFVDKILREICRCLEMPFTIATGDSSDSNYASGRLEVQSWQRKATKERKGAQRVLLNPIANAWLREAALIDGYLPLADIGPPENWGRFWQWDGWDHVDPVKKASADDIALKNASTTLQRVYSSQGLDWVEAVEQLAIEYQKCKSLGIPHPSQMASPAAKMPTQEPPANSDQAKGVANAANA